MIRRKKATVGDLKRRCIAFAIASIAATSLSAAATGEPVILNDATGRSVTIKDASRIVSIGGAITEILYALGRDRQIIAVDTTSLYPTAALQQKPNVGYMRQLSPEGVLGLRPSLVIAIEGAGPKEAVAVLESSSVPFLSVPDHFTGAGVIDKIRVVAQATASKERGGCLAAAVNADLEALAKIRTHITMPAKVLFVMSLAGDRLLIAGRNTAADGIIALAGGVNAMGAYEGYKTVNDEAVVDARPDAVLVMQRSQQNLTYDDIFSRPAFAATPAAAHRAYISIEGLYLLGFGPRTPRAARDLAASLYPDLQAAALPSDTAAESSPVCR